MQRKYVDRRCDTDLIENTGIPHADLLQSQNYSFNMRKSDGFNREAGITE